jgi:UDP-N-acetylglucosamine--N-acetylmuramyl-(pentapeptide) pyrophosphoryl-undecaprenol N-acetylglucosamine transferase
MIIACGGTGGHVYPAIAIADAMSQRHPEGRILFVVKNGSFENKVFSELEYDFVTIPAAGLSRVSFKSNIKLLWILPMSLIKAFGILLSACPKVVLSTGGYSGLPVLFVSILLRKKIFLQEQNTYPGITMRLFAGFAECVYLGYKEASAFIGKSTRYMETGNPIRENTGRTEESIKKKISINSNQKMLFISGGSQGAQAINKLIAAILPELVSSRNVVVIWQCGRANEEFARNTAKGLMNVHVYPYMDNIYDFYSSADLAVCRTGAMTLSELARFSLPAILIPLPNSAGDHQQKNAIGIEARGGGVCFNQYETAAKLKKLITELLNDSDALAVMRNKMGQLYKSDAASVIADDIWKEIKR